MAPDLTASSKAAISPSVAWARKRSTDQMEGYDQFSGFHKKTYGEDVKYQDFANKFKAEIVP